MHKKGSQDDTFFVRFINKCFEKCAIALCKCPWAFILVSTALTLALSVKIPLTRMQNDISDFTPYGARSRQELQVYREFFANRGEPKAVYAFINAKHGDMLGLPQLNHTVQVLDTISKSFFLKTSQGPKNFEQYCNAFCLLNEPVRHFYSGMLISGQHGSDGRHLDLGYPVTTVLGTKLFMDPNFFGVKVAVNGSSSGGANDVVEERVVSVAENSAFAENMAQVPDNIRELGLVVLQFRAELGAEVDGDDLRDYERQIVDYFHSNFTSSFINVYVLTDSYITEEIVRAGLTLLPFLAIGFTIMAVFSSCTFAISAFALKQMNVYKIVLAVMACVCPFMACGATLGGMFLAGFRFGSILCVTPFLVLAIGVDDAYLMVNAWQRITTRRRKHRVTNVSAELQHRMVEMFIETGPSVTITTITNVLAFGIGATTPAAEIQLFSIGNAIAVVMDLIFQITVYGALMVIVGRYEIEAEAGSWSDDGSIGSEELGSTEKPGVSVGSEPDEQTAIDRFIGSYCNLLCNKWVCSLVLGLLAAYWYVCIVGTLNIKAELSPEKLFLEESNIVQVFSERKRFIIPYYSACWVLVENPGDMADEQQRAVLENMVRAFEGLPSSNGRYSTKFWLRDYEDFLRQSEEIDLPEAEDDELDLAIEFTRNGSQAVTPAELEKGNELKQFLEWPEFSFWKGFIQFNKSHSGQEYHVTKFFFTTAFHGSGLVDWSNRAKLLDEWRAVADQFPSLNVSVYEEDAKFLDLIGSMASVAAQSAVWTFVCMFIVAALFISHPPTLFVATFSILSTSIGVFGIMSWWGADLDPIMMSATVMSIGFSVDIPSHISYHYFQTGKSVTDVQTRLHETIRSVGFPIIEASVSTSLCVVSLFFVNLNMAQVFAKCMLLVVLIGLVHGMVVMPVIFSLLATVPNHRSFASSAPHPALARSSASTSSTAPVIQ